MVKKDTLIVHACSDKRKFWEEAIKYAQEIFPNDHIYLVADFGSIKNIVGFPGSLMHHPTFQTILELGYDKFMPFAHEDCAGYRRMLEGLSREQEKEHHIGEMRSYYIAVRQIIPSARIFPRYQELDEAKTGLAETVPLKI
jgi:hypothetical protein